MAASYQALKASFERTILDPSNKAPLVLLKAIRNGAVYGTKVRFPHALVMIFLFRSGTLREKLRAIFKATRQHATNLAKFAFLYKSAMLALRVSRADGKEQGFHSFVAGLAGGYWVFGHGKNANNGVNQQIVIYVAARVVLALAKLCVQPRGEGVALSVGGSQAGGRGGVGLLGVSEEQAGFLRAYTWPAFAALSWAGVMWLFEQHPDSLQPSLKSSMTYIYANAETWDSARNFLWHNK